MHTWRAIQSAVTAAVLATAGVALAQSPGAGASPAQQPAPAQPAQPQPQAPATASPGNDKPAFVAPDTALHIAIERLREEGRQFRATGNLPRQEADFAESFEYFVRPRDLHDAVAAVQDREDAAVDGYIRWQLLSFDADWGAMDGDAYERLIGNLPRLLRCASADTQSHEALERLALDAGRNAEVRAELQRRWDAIHFDDKQVELLNQPALKFRNMLADAMPETGMRLLGVLIFDLQGRIAAACDTRAVKSRITRTLRERMNDDSITIEQRWQLIRYIEDLPGPESKVVRDVVVYAAQPADVLYSTYAIRSSDVKKWTAYLNRHEP